MGCLRWLVKLGSSFSLFVFFFFFLFIHTRIQPYVDYGGVLVNHFFSSAVPPRYVSGLGGSALAPQPHRLSTPSTGN